MIKHQCKIPQPSPQTCSVTYQVLSQPKVGGWWLLHRGNVNIYFQRGNDWNTSQCHEESKPFVSFIFFLCSLIFNSFFLRKQQQQQSAYLPRLTLLLYSMSGKEPSILELEGWDSSVSRKVLNIQQASRAGMWHSQSQLWCTWAQYYHFLRNTTHTALPLPWYMYLMSCMV